MIPFSKEKLSLKTPSPFPFDSLPNSPLTPGLFQISMVLVFLLTGLFLCTGFLIFKYLIIVIKFAENVDENYQINSKRERKIANNNVATNLKGIQAFIMIKSKSYRLARKIKAR